MEHNSIEIQGEQTSEVQEILTPTALELLQHLHRTFNSQRLELLKLRKQRQQEIDDGALPEFLPHTQSIRDDNWSVAPLPDDLMDRRVEITGPVDRKMIINALNAPVKTFMADFEDSCSPTWNNIIHGQTNLRDAVNKNIEFISPDGSKTYALNEKIATLIVRPRGWHLHEKNLLIDGEPVSASLFDFCLYLTTNFEQLAKNGTGPYFYLPKLENHLEARLWNDVFVMSQNKLGMQQGTIKATVLIETILAAFEMDEILFELREHSSGLNCGRWDYIFSFIKKFRNRSDFILPDRDTVTMTRHFLKSYVDALIQTCHKRGVHAMGGMAAQIPIKNDPEGNIEAMEKVKADKLREAHAGHDGTWIAHPGLASIAMDSFDAVMKESPNQLHNLREEVRISSQDLLTVPTGDVTDTGLRHNIRVGVQYLEAWLSGNGCVPLYNLMEDAATAEICRSQIWQWITHKVKTNDDQIIDEERFTQSLQEEISKLIEERGDLSYDPEQLKVATDLFHKMSTNQQFDQFLTLPAYKYL